MACQETAQCSLKCGIEQVKFLHPRPCSEPLVDKRFQASLQNKYIADTRKGSLMHGPDDNDLRVLKGSGFATLAESLRSVVRLRMVLILDICEASESPRSCTLLSPLSLAAFFSPCVIEYDYVFKILPARLARISLTV